MLPSGDQRPQSISDYDHSSTATNIRGAVLSSPMSIGIPAGTEDPIVLDMATSFSGNQPKDIFKSLGLQAAVVALGCDPRRGRPNHLETMIPDCS